MTDIRELPQQVARAGRKVRFRTFKYLTVIALAGAAGAYLEQKYRVVERLQQQVRPADASVTDIASTAPFDSAVADGDAADAMVVLDAPNSERNDRHVPPPSPRTPHMPTPATR